MMRARRNVELLFFALGSASRLINIDAVLWECLLLKGKEELEEERQQILDFHLFGDKKACFHGVAD